MSMLAEIVERDASYGDMGCTCLTCITIEDRRWLLERVNELSEALRVEIAAIIEYDSGSTHFDDCWKTHRGCAAVRRMRIALAKLEQR